MRQHGTRSSYVAGCHCPECTAANNEYAKARERAKAREAWVGGSYRVSPEAARLAIIRLEAMGYNRNEIARAAGISKNSLANIYHGRNKNGGPLEYVTRETTERLLALIRSGNRARAPRQLVDAAPYQAALNAWRQVFTTRELARMMGLSLAQIRALIYTPRPRMQERTAQAFRKASPIVSKEFARKRGQVPAQTWQQRQAEREAAGFVVNPYR